ncbi:zinc finger matrin-type protein 1-like [Melanerpes formicivorus]|uniref:zinc finger matrin-type protein 1-like n=1 Tax=Melanerpes formicivorus TaxID=211600 RepID=UPI00358F0649
MNEVPVPAWILVAEAGITAASPQGKRRAWELQLCVQRCAEEAVRRKRVRRRRANHLPFQVDWSGGVGSRGYCNPCNVFCPAPIAASAHCSEKGHPQKVKQLSGDQGQLPAQPLQPAPALQKPEKPLLPATAEGASSSSSALLKFKDSDKYCKLCCAPFITPLVAQAHYGGKRHRKNEARRKILEELGEEAVPAEFRMNAFGLGYYLCQVCNVTMTAIEGYLSHVRGTKHQMNLLSQQPAACEQAQGETPSRHSNKACSEEEQVSEVATVTQKSFNLSVSESKDGYQLLFAETSTSFYRKEQKIKIKIEEEN